MGRPLLYDADCGFCRVSVALVLTWDRRRRLRPLAIQSEEAGELLAPMPEQERMASWHLVLPDGSVRSAGAAFPPLLRELPSGTALAALAERFPDAAERGYRLVARHRSTLGRRLPKGVRRWAAATIERRLADRNSPPPERLSAR